MDMDVGVVMAVAIRMATVYDYNTNEKEN